MAVWQKTSYLSSAQMAATDSLTAVQTNGYLGTASIQKLVSEYLSQTRNITDSQLSAGQGANNDNNPFTANCKTGTILGADGSVKMTNVTFPYIEVSLDVNRGTTSGSNSDISTYAYTSQGLSGTVTPPAHGTISPTGQYRVINAKIWEASQNLSIFGNLGQTSKCQGYAISVSAILFGSNQDLTNGSTCFQPDAFPVTPLVQEVKTLSAKVRVSPYDATCTSEIGNIPQSSIVTVTGTYRNWSQVTLPDGTKGWILTSSLQNPSTWTISYDPGCDSGGCATMPTTNPTTYSWANGTAPIPLANPSKNHYNYAGWQRYDCNTLANQGSASTKMTIPFGSYGNLCFKPVFAIQQVFVTFNPGAGATGGAAQTQYNWGSTVPIPTCPTKPGYNFNGWMDPSGNLIPGSANCASPGSIVVTGADLSISVYTASWGNATYNITKNAAAGCSSSTGGGTGAGSYTFSTSSQSVNLGYGPAPGYSSPVWTVTSGPGTISLNNLVLPANATGAVTVSATCAPITYSITALSSPSGGTAAASPSTYTINPSASQSVTLSPPTLTGYAFSSWSVTNNSSGVTSTVSGNTLTIPAGAYGNISVTANMTAQTYTITYYCNGRGTCPTSPSTYTYGVNPWIPDASGGGTFNGWTVNYNNTSAGAGNGWNVLPAGITGNVVLYAHWTWTVQTYYTYGASLSWSAWGGGSNMSGGQWSWSCSQGGWWVGGAIQFYHTGLGVYSAVSGAQSGSMQVTYASSTSKIQLAQASGTCGNYSYSTQSW